MYRKIVQDKHWDSPLSIWYRKTLMWSVESGCGETIILCKSLCSSSVITYLEFGSQGKLVMCWKQTAGKTETLSKPDSNSVTLSTMRTCKTNNGKVVMKVFPLIAFRIRLKLKILRFNVVSANVNVHVIYGINIDLNYGDGSIRQVFFKDSSHE